MMCKKSLFSLVVSMGIAYGAALTANATTTHLIASKISHTAIDRALGTLENEMDKIFISLMGVGKRCVARDQICRFYYRGHFYETPWWTAPVIY